MHGDNEETWHPGAEYLVDWLVQRRIGRYRYRWSPQADDVVAYTVIGHLLPQEQARYFLTHGGKSHLEALVAALHNPNNDDNPVAKVVKTVRTRLIQREYDADPVRIDAKAIEALKMDARDAVATLKRAGYILAVDGLDFGLDLSGDKPSRYVLIKMRR